MTVEEKIKAIYESTCLDELKIGVLPEVHHEDYYFVSYSHHDYREVFRDMLLFQNAGVNVWYDGGMPPEKSWEDQAKEHIASYRCKRVIFYWSENSLLSESLIKEVGYAKQYGKPFFSINLPNPQMPGPDYSAAAMLEYMGKTQKKLCENDKLISENFGSSILYLTYNSTLERKIESIEKLIQPELIQYRRGTHWKTALVSNLLSIDVVSITVPAHVQIEGEWCEVVEVCPAVFANNKIIENIVLPNTVKTIGDYAFFGCTSLRTIKMDGVSYVGLSAFAQCSHLSIDTVSFICQDGAFRECVNLKEVKITNDLYVLPNNVFEGCKELKKITLPDSLSKIENRAFAGCEKLEMIRIPSPVKEIEPYAFYECTNLETVALHSGLVSIGSHTFAKCRMLREISIPDTVTEVGEEAFRGCYSLTDAKYSANAETIPPRCFFWCKTLEFVEIPEGVTTIKEKAFSRCDSLGFLVLPDSVVNMDSDALSYCSAEVVSNVLPSRCFREPVTMLELAEAVHALEEMFGITLKSTTEMAIETSCEEDGQEHAEDSNHAVCQESDNA